jgi:hypothetical protein
MHRCIDALCVYAYYIYMDRCNRADMAAQQLSIFGQVAGGIENGDAELA